MHAVSLGRPLGLTDDQVRSTVDGSWNDRCWNAEQSTVFRLADELHGTGTVSDELWEGLSTHFDAPQILELLVTAGWYHVISFVCNGARVEQEDWAERFPSASSRSPDAAVRPARSTAR